MGPKRKESKPSQKKPTTKRAKTTTTTAETELRQPDTRVAFSPWYKEWKENVKRFAKAIPTDLKIPVPETSTTTKGMVILLNPRPLPIRNTENPPYARYQGGFVGFKHIPVRFEKDLRPSVLRASIDHPAIGLKRDDAVVCIPEYKIFWFVPKRDYTTENNRGAVNLHVVENEWSVSGLINNNLSVRFDFSITTDQITDAIHSQKLIQSKLIHRLLSRDFQLVGFVSPLCDVVSAYVY